MTHICTHTTHLTTYNTYDPTRTLSLRRSFERALRKRFRELRGVINEAIVDKDVFGLTGGNMMTQQRFNSPQPRAFNFPRSDQKVAGFMTWLNRQVDQGMLQTTQIQQVGESVDSAWTNTYIRDSYKRGVIRARYELGKAGFEVPSLEQTGGISASMNTPFHVDRLGLLYTRTFNELKGITDGMSQIISRELTQGIADGDNPRLLARKLNAVISGNRIGELGITDRLGRFIPAERRAEMLARTEIVRAHHSATMQEYKNWRVEGVRVKAEWMTAGDNRVCPRCESWEIGTPKGGYPLEQVENQIPLHPSCRCIALPVKSDEVITPRQPSKVPTPENMYKTYPTAKDKVKEYADNAPGTLVQRTVQYSHQSGQLNRALRSGTLSDSAQAYRGNITYKEWANSVDDFLKNAPKYEGTTYRGMGWLEQGGKNEFLNKLKKQGIYTDDAYISTSAKQSIAKENPLVQIGGNSGDGAVVVKIEGRSGVPIGKITPYQQEEVLFPRGSKFEFLELNKNKFGEGIDEVVVREIID